MWENLCVICIILCSWNQFFGCVKTQFTPDISITLYVRYSSYPCLILYFRGWRCIKGFPASGRAPLTRPCPSSPSNGSPPTPGEVSHDTIRDKNIQAGEHVKGSIVRKRWSTKDFVWSLCTFFFCLLCLHWIAAPQRVVLVLLLPPAGS